MSKHNGRVRYLVGAFAGAVLALASVAGKAAAAPESFLYSAGTSPFVAADQTPPAYSRESDSRRRHQRQSRADVERHRRGLDIGRRTVAPIGTDGNFTPALPNAALQLPNATPQLPNAVPQLPNAIPRLPNGVPQLPNAVPQFRDAAPSVPTVEPLPDRP